MYSFEFECDKFSPEEIIGNFIRNLSSTDCYHTCNYGTNKIILTKSMVFSEYSFKFVLPFNLWWRTGDIKIEVKPNYHENSHLVKFSIDNSHLFIPLVFINLSFIVGAFYSKQWVVISILLIINFILVGDIYILMLRHRKFVIKTLEKGIFKPKSEKIYNWNKIMKDKDTSELIMISKGKTHLPQNVIAFALEELKNRNVLVD